MNYILNITRREETPDFAEKMVEYKDARNNSYMMDKPYQPERFQEVNALTVEVTEEQFEAIRKAVLEKF